MIDEVQANKSALVETLGESLTPYVFNSTVTLPLQHDAHQIDCFSLHDMNGIHSMIQPSAKLQMTMNIKHGSRLSRTTLMLLSSSGTKVNLQHQRNKDEYSTVQNLMEGLFDEGAEVEEDDLKSIDSSNNKINNSLFKANNMVPVTIFVARTINGVKSNIPLRVLLDSRSTSNHVFNRALPIGCKPMKILAQEINLLEGTVVASSEVCLKDIALTQFSRNKRVNQLKCFVALGQLSSFNVILGRQGLWQLGLVLDFDKDKMSFMDHVVPHETSNTYISSTVLLTSATTVPCIFG
jgi:hypothetical protein